MVVEQSTRVCYMSYETFDVSSATLNGEIILYGHKSATFWDLTPCRLVEVHQRTIYKTN
jgi:hypothetical protein